MLTWDMFYAGWERLQQGWYSLGISAADKDLGHRGSGVGERIRDFYLKRERRLHHDWTTIGSLIDGTECSDIRYRVFGVMAMFGKPLRIFPDYSMQLQDVMLGILRKQVEYTYRDVKGRKMNDLDVRDKQRLEGKEMGCFLTAYTWCRQLDNETNPIDLRTVRHHLLQIMEANSPSSSSPLKRVRWLKSRFRLWYMISNPGCRWSLAATGVETCYRERIGGQNMTEYGSIQVNDIKFSPEDCDQQTH